MDDFPFIAKKAEVNSLVSHAKWLAKRKSTPAEDKALFERLISDNKKQGALKHVIHMFPHISPLFPCTEVVRMLLSSSFKFENFEYQCLSEKPTEREKSAEEARETIHSILISGYRIRRIIIVGMKYPPELLELIQLAKPAVLDIKMGITTDTEDEETLKRVGALVTASETVKIVKIVSIFSGFHIDLLQYLHESFILKVFTTTVYNCWYLTIRI